MAVELENLTTKSAQETVEMPAPTAWPIVLAFGMTLVFAGMVTSAAISVLGAILSLTAAVGWFREVLPHEIHESAALERQAPAPTSLRHEVARAEIGEDMRRAWLPVEIHPVSAGVKGGLAGSVAMAALAAMYGLVSGNGIWYPINLLAAGFFPVAASMTTAEIAGFHPRAFLIAVPIHLVTSLLVGLLYGAMLPMLPRQPIVLGGFIAPIMWSGLIYGSLGIINPVLNQRIDWVWFMISQSGFGIVAGLVVTRTAGIRTRQGMPLALRAGMESPGIMENRGEDLRP